jgi:hypothetical protein
MRKRCPLLAEIDWKKRRDEIVKSLGKYKDPSSAGTEYFIWFKGKSFPPKGIRSLVENKAKHTFSGGGKTNQMFRDLGFAVVKGLNQRSIYERSLKQRPGVQSRVSGVSKYLGRLFHERWRSFEGQLKSSVLRDRPGVYVLAYAHEKLENKRVKPEDVFYVGVSTTCLRKRLKQFSDGLDEYGHHSGAMRFYKRWAGGRRFSRLDGKGTFYVATASMECQTRKGLRTPRNLEDLGLVAALEFYVLAHIKRELDLEPPLNKK